MKNLEHVGGRPTIRIRAAEKKQNKGGAAIQALVRANLRQAEQIGSLYQEHDALALQTSSLKEDRMRTWRLVLGIEGRHDELDDRIKKMNRIGNDLNGRVKALEYSRTKDRPLEPATKEKYTQLAHRLDTVEMRAQRQEQDISQAKELREKTTEVLLTLSGTFENHRDTIMEVKNSVERSKKWKKRLDEVTKEQKTRTEQLESEVQRQKEETRNFKTATEGQFNAMTKHHQEDSDVVMKRMAALEKIVESQNSQICYLKTLVSPRTGAAEAATSPGKICKRILSTGGHTRGFAIEKTIGIEPRQVANY
jgi:chromosome segregation ATPase